MKKLLENIILNWRKLMSYLINPNIDKMVHFQTGNKRTFYTFSTLPITSQFITIYSADDGIYIDDNDAPYYICDDISKFEQYVLDKHKGSKITVTQWDFDDSFEYRVSINSELCYIIDTHDIDDVLKKDKEHLWGSFKAGLVDGKWIFPEELNNGLVTDDDIRELFT